MKTVRSTFNVSFFLKKSSIKKNGNAPIIARITINGQLSHFSTKVEIPPSEWNVKLGKAVKGKEAVNINRRLEDIKAKLISLYHQFISQVGTITAEKLKNNFLGIDEKYETILELFDRHNEDLKKLIGITISECTYKKHLLARKRVSDFIQKKYHVTDMQARDINLMFIQDYEIYLRVDCKLCNNVAAKTIQYLKKIVVFAFNNGVIQINPFNLYKIKVQKVDKGYLTQEEVNIIAEKKIDFERLDNVRDCFLLSVFTGISYIDLYKLSPENIVIETNGRKWLIGKRKKTGGDFSIPLLPVALRIIEKWKNKAPEGKIMKVISNQKLNSYLKELADICGIRKNLTFHLARHRSLSFGL